MTDAAIRPNRWISRSRPRPDAPAQLVCLPNAGAGPSMYGRWHIASGHRAEVVAVSLPGRESRSTEPAATDLNQLARRIAVALLPVLDRPYALFGHSMGALLAYSIAQALPAVGGPEPLRLVMSAARPPDLAFPAAVATNGDEQLIASLRELGGMPDEVLAHPELLTLLLDPLRTDLMAVDAFRPLPGPPSCPVALVAGAADRHVPPAVMAGWRRFIKDDAPVYALPGNHFYLRERTNVDALQEIALAEIGSGGGAGPPPYDGFVVEPFDGDEAALAALSPARLPGRPASRPSPGRDPLRLAVQDGDRLIAYADCVADAGDANRYHVGILVHPRFARRGLGGLLLDECRAFAVTTGRSELATDIDRHDEVSASWLAARGFRPAGHLDGRTMWRLRTEG